MRDTRLRVLVVEDEAEILALICQMLQLLDHDPVPARGGAAAIALIRTQRFDLAVVDTMMPGMDGHEVRDRIREHQPHMRIITASGSPQHLAAGGLEPGQHVYLRKPFRADELDDAIRSLICPQTA